MAKIFPTNPVQRLMDTVIPDVITSDFANPVVRKLQQIPGFGNEQCTPQAAGIKLRDSFDALPVPNVIEHIAHAKRWIKEKITGYIDGYLPTVLRRIKYAADVLKLLRYVAQIIATLRFLQSLLRKEVALANEWASECDAVIGFAESNLTPVGLETQAEAELRSVLQKAHTDISQQVQENNQNLSCLI